MAKQSVSSSKSASHATTLPVTEPDETMETPEAAKQRLFKKLQPVSALLPVMLALVFSINTLWLEFVSDDYQQVLGNNAIRDIRNLPKALSTTVWGFINLDIAPVSQPYYRPLFSVWFMGVYAIFGTKAWGWHLMNVLIHALATWLVFLVLNQLSGRKRLALIAASLFAVHPVHTESVAWISGITDPLMAIFLLPAFYFYLKLRESGKPVWMVAMLVFHLLALLNKETALALPVIVAYCELFYFNEAEAFNLKLAKAAKLIGAFLLPIVIFLLVRYYALGTFSTLEELRYPLSATLLTIPLALTKYLVLVSLPYGYSYQHYTGFITSATSLNFILPLLLVMALAAVFILAKSRLVKFAGAWFLIFLLPALAAIKNFDQEYLVQERYLYLPSMGFCLLLGLGIEWLVERQFAGRRYALVALTSVIVLGFGILQIRQSLFWQDTVTVYQRCIAVAPTSAEAHASIANVYYTAGKPREAEAAARTALELDQQCNNAYLTLSYFSKQSGNLNQAIDYLEQAKVNVSVTPLTRSSIATTYLNLGLLYGQKKDFQKAEENLEQSLALWTRANGFYQVGLFYSQQNKLETALSYYLKMRELVPPHNAFVHATMGAMYEKLQQNDQAIAEYIKYMETATVNASDRQFVQERLNNLQKPKK
ncbi:MAG: tetratricopeptide repeat protein [Acidobacteriota bacterium]